MNKFPKILKITGKLWLVLSVTYILVSYFLNMLISNEPFVARFLAFINIWNVFLAFILILPGYLLTVLSEKIERNYKEL